jgi:hypothetical protein
LLAWVLWGEETLSERKGVATPEKDKGAYKSEVS